jgi:N-methylhydantoinase B/oxoprolinase/acetone carboxylase alpha subunit
MLKGNGFRLKGKDVISCRTGGGGDAGDSLQRSLVRVAKDIAGGYIMKEHDEKVYGATNPAVLARLETGFPPRRIGLPPVRE